MSKKGKIQVLEQACPFCNGDVFTGYKRGKVWKCIQGSHYLWPDSDIASKIACQNCHQPFRPYDPDNPVAYCPYCGQATPNIRHPRWTGQLKQPTVEEKEQAQGFVEEC